MSILDTFRSYPRPDGDDDDPGDPGDPGDSSDGLAAYAGAPSWRRSGRVMRCLTVGCERPALDADAFCAVCAGRRLALMVFHGEDLEDWPTRATQEPLTNPTMPALPAISPAVPALNAAGDPPLAPSAWEAPGAEAATEAASCRWCVWEMSEWQRGAYVAHWMVAHPGPWRVCQTHAQRWPQFQRGLGRSR